jgi:hypothetical protein
MPIDIIEHPVYIEKPGVKPRNFIAGLYTTATTTPSLTVWALFGYSEFCYFHFWIFLPGITKGKNILKNKRHFSTNAIFIGQIIVN